jgi:outer membrane protein OmpA-like peptidoglycan-associated protein
MLQIPFDLDGSTLSGAAQKQLDELGRALAAGVAGDAVLRMVGYASPEGDEDYNHDLSRLRVDAVAAYLVERWDVAAQRIESTAAGEAEPVRNRDGSVNYERSRRVELSRGLGTVPCGDEAGS